MTKRSYPHSCLICGKECLNGHKLQHHLRSHNLTTKEYYDSYFDDTKICSVCGGHNMFQGFIHGYSRSCSRLCSGRDPIAKDKRRQTHIDRYGGIGMASAELKSKTKSTNLDKYGHENYFGSEAGKAHIKEVWKEHYGEDVVNPFQAEEIKEKIKNTNLSRYGVEYISQADEFKDKIKHTNLEKYGVDNTSKLKSTQIKIAKTLRKRLDKFANDNNLFLITDLTEKSLGDLDLKIIKFKNNNFTDLDGKEKIEEYLKSNVSQFEFDVRYFLKGLNVDVDFGNRKLIHNKELDLVVDNHVFEVDGYYYHSEKDHQSKLIECRDINLTLLRINDNMWYKKRHLTENLIKNILKLDLIKIIGEIKLIEEINDFSKIEFDDVERNYSIYVSETLIGGFLLDNNVVKNLILDFRYDLSEVVQFLKNRFNLEIDANLFNHLTDWKELSLPSIFYVNQKKEKSFSEKDGFLPQYDCGKLVIKRLL